MVTFGGACLAQLGERVTPATQAASYKTKQTPTQRSGGINPGYLPQKYKTYILQKDLYENVLVSFFIIAPN